MKVLLNTAYDVPEGWYYDVPETGFRVMGAHTYPRLIKAVRSHYNVNALDVPRDLEIQVQSQIAKRVPDRMTREIEP